VTKARSRSGSKKSLAIISEHYSENFNFSFADLQLLDSKLDRQSEWFLKATILNLKFKDGRDFQWLQPVLSHLTYSVTSVLVLDENYVESAAI
jgi:hypothetical protein